MVDVLPCPPLRRYVDRYWTLSDERPPAPILPGTGAELLLPANAPSRLLCVRRRTDELPAGIAFFAIRFRAGALRHFTAVPLAELADADAAPSDLWGRALAARLQDADLDEQVRAADGLLLAALERFAKPDPRPDRAARALYAARGGLRIERLARDLGSTRRQLERGFKGALGISPKAFAGVARLQAAVRAVVASRALDYLPAALDAGYFDQAHFVHEFRRITGHAPTSYFAAARAGAHFYKPSYRTRSELRVSDGRPLPTTSETSCRER